MKLSVFLGCMLFQTGIAKILKNDDSRQLSTSNDDATVLPFFIKLHKVSSSRPFCSKRVCFFFLPVHFVIGGIVNSC
jgi:hypothetical protein